MCQVIFLLPLAVVALCLDAGQRELIPVDTCHKEGAPLWSVHLVASVLGETEESHVRVRGAVKMVFFTPS